MTAPHVPWSSLDGIRDGAVVVRLEQENAQLRHAVGSHATMDHLGVLTAIHQLAPAVGFEVLREVSQHTNTKLHTVAETVIAWALGSRCRNRWDRSCTRPWSGAHAGGMPQARKPGGTRWSGTARVRRSGPARRWDGSR
jgi:hypothetical protein